MKGPDDDTPAPGTPGSGSRFPADADQTPRQPDPAATQQGLPIFDLDSPLIVEDEDPPDDAFEDWSCWPCPDENLWAACGDFAVGDLRNPPRGPTPDDPP